MPFFVQGETVITAVGGWGPLLGDEGSGYEIGLNALKAAIYSHDGRRAKSMLYDLVMEKWNLTNLWGIVTHLAGNPEAHVEKPLFEPVVGCAVLRALRDGLSMSDVREPLTKGFQEFLYP